jgi:hypothetical protein
VNAQLRLDPVRRRPWRSTLARLLAVTALLVVAALVTWSGSSACGPASTAPIPSTGPVESTGPAGAPPDADAASTDSAGASPGSGGATTGSRGRSERGSPVLGERNGSSDGDGPPTRSRIPDGSVGVPVRLAEPAALALLRPGDRVDLFRVEEAGGTTTIAAAAVVLSMTGDDPLTGAIMVALRPPEAEEALAGPGRGFAVLLRPG